LNCNDVILHLLDMVIAEKEKNIILQQQLEQQTEHMQDNNKVKTD